MEKLTNAQKIGLSIALFMLAIYLGIAITVTFGDPLSNKTNYNKITKNIVNEIDREIFNVVLNQDPEYDTTILIYTQVYFPQIKNNTKLVLSKYFYADGIFAMPSNVDTIKFIGKRIGIKFYNENSVPIINSKSLVDQQIIFMKDLDISIDY